MNDEQRQRKDTETQGRKENEINDPFAPLRHSGLV